MHVSFDSTVDEVVDLAMRAQRTTSTYRKLHWSVAAFVGLAVFISVATNGAGSGAARAIPAVIGAAVSVSIYHVLAYGINRWYARHSVRRYIGDAMTVHSEVEIREDGVMFRETSMDVLLKWSDIAQAEVTRDGVEIRRPDRIVGLVRTRGFSSPEAQHAFAAEVNRKALAKPGRAAGGV